VRSFKEKVPFLPVNAPRTARSTQRGFRSRHSRGWDRAKAQRSARGSGEGRVGGGVRRGARLVRGASPIVRSAVTY
jgi:hypothetical protein